MIPPERGTFLRLQVFESVGVSLNEVYGKGKEICHFDLKGLTERFYGCDSYSDSVSSQRLQFFREFSCFMSLTARCVCEAAGFYYTNNSTQFTCIFTSWKITVSSQLPKIPFSKSTWKTDVNISAWLCRILEKIRLSVWSMSRLNSSLPLVNILHRWRQELQNLGEMPSSARYSSISSKCQCKFVS